LIGRRIETKKGDQLFRRTFASSNGAETMQEDKEREGRCWRQRPEWNGAGVVRHPNGYDA
jgi:hypothetical protein